MKTLIITLVLLLIPFKSYGVVRTIPEVKTYAEILPKQFTDKYDGHIYIVDEIKGHSEFDGMYFHNSHDIYVTWYCPSIIIHELAHYVYYNTEWDMDTASIFNDARKGFYICGYADLDTYDYYSEIFAYMTEAYYRGTLTCSQKNLYEQLINRILAKENWKQ